MKLILDFKFSSFLILNVFALFLFSGSVSVNAQAGAVGMDPTRIEVVIPAGTEKTVGTTIDYSREIPNVELSPARLIARIEDWTIMPDGDVKFAPVNTLDRSAASWITASTSEFTLAPETSKTIRYTVSVPKGTPPGDYHFAVYVESRDAPPPPKEGTKQIIISFRRYLLVYVLVPNLTFEGELLGLDTKIDDGRLTAFPKLNNLGNSRLRPQHKFEIVDAANKSVFASDMSEARVLLGNHSWQMAYPIDADLPAGKYTLKYTVDFGDKKALQVGKTTFELTGEDVAARQKYDEQVTAQNKAEESAPPISITPEQGAKPNTAQPKAVEDDKTKQDVGGLTKPENKKPLR